MLILCRQRGQRILIGDNIVMTVVSIDRNKVRLGFEAPVDVPIYRDELLADRDGPREKLQADPFRPGRKPA